METPTQQQDATTSPAIDKLLNLLNARHSLAEDFTKYFQKDVKKSIDDYELDCTDEELEIINADDRKRYEFKIRYIMSTHDSYMSSAFGMPLDLIIKNRGAMGEEKALAVEATYEYLKDKLNLSDWTEDTAWWFILTGWTSGHALFKNESIQVPAVNPDTNEPLLDEQGEQLTVTKYLYNDPIIEVGDPMKEIFSPESKFSVDASKIPYMFREASMDIDEIEELYGKKVKSDAKIGNNSDDTDSIKKNDTDRATVHFYYGNLSKKVYEEASKKDYAKGLEDVNWSYSALFYCIYTSSHVLYMGKLDVMPSKFARWMKVPNKFFGFGLGKTLREIQSELKLTRGQQNRYKDLFAFAKMIVDEEQNVDEKNLRDPRENVIVSTSGGAKPEYMTPPQMPNALMQVEQSTREDGQFISGITDYSQGDSNTINTATGQTIRSRESAKKVEHAKTVFYSFYRAFVIHLLKLCAENWEETKIVEIMDGNGDTVSLELTKESLQGIDFDKDIDIDVESLSVNREVEKAQKLEFYKISKDLPFINQPELWKDVAKSVFDKKNPDKYILSQEQQQMGMPQDPNMQQPQQMASQDQIPTSQGSMLGAAVQA